MYTSALQVLPFKKKNACHIVHTDAMAVVYCKARGKILSDVRVSHEERERERGRERCMYERGRERGRERCM